MALRVNVKRLKPRQLKKYDPFVMNQLYDGVFIIFASLSLVVIILGLAVHIRRSDVDDDGGIGGRD
jgi:hypothetical protein